MLDYDYLEFVLRLLAEWVMYFDCSVDIHPFDQHLNSPLRSYYTLRPILQEESTNLKWIWCKKKNN